QNDVTIINVLQHKYRRHGLEPDCPASFPRSAWERGANHTDIEHLAINSTTRPMGHRGRNMCDLDTLKDSTRHLERKARLGEINRRQFGALSAGAGLMALLPAVANAQEVTEENVEITTPDGVADCYFVHPATGSHAAVLV